MPYHACVVSSVFDSYMPYHACVVPSVFDSYMPYHACVVPSVFNSYMPDIACVVSSVFDSYLSQRDYDPKRFPMLSKTLSELIKERVKDTGLNRYKIIAMVTICENKDQGTRVVSRCLWNQKFDNHASVVYEGPNYYAVGSVYAVYFE